MKKKKLTIELIFVLILIKDKKIDKAECIGSSFSPTDLGVVLVSILCLKDSPFYIAVKENT